MIYASGVAPETSRIETHELKTCLRFFDERLVTKTTSRNIASDPSLRTPKVLTLSGTDGPRRCFDPPFHYKALH